MKRTIYISWLLTIVMGCQNSNHDSNKSTLEIGNSLTSNIIQFELPFKGNCGHFLTWNDMKRIFQSKDTIWSVQSNQEFDIIIKNQNDIARPFLITMNTEGITIDSLLLFDEVCYIGCDCDYQPWLEISKDLKIIWTDTAYYTSSFINNDTTTVVITTDTVITKQVYQIEINGQITKVANKK